jgi:hypothetical protein
VPNPYRKIDELSYLYQAAKIEVYLERLEISKYG